MSVDKAWQTFEASAASCRQRRLRQQLQVGQLEELKQLKQFTFLTHPRLEPTTGIQRHGQQSIGMPVAGVARCRIEPRLQAASGKALTKVQQVAAFLPSLLPLHSARILRPQRCHLNINICHRVSCRIPRAVASCGPRNVPKNKQNPIKVKWNMARQKQQQQQ